MSSMAYIMIFGLLAGLTASSIYGLYWAARRGQFASFQKNAASIFDEEEPIGFRTDAFPDETKKTRKA
jgi:nitrogen fixation-related uncharacterized protein